MACDLCGLALLEIVAPVFLLLGLGYALRKAKILTAQADESLTGFVVKVLVPCLAIDILVGNPAFDRVENLIIPPIAGFLIVALGFGIFRLGAVIARLEPGPVSRTFVHTGGIQNYSYIPLPLCIALFDREVVGILLAFNLGVELAFWSVGIAALTGQTSPRDWLKILNPPIVAIIAALSLNALNAEAWIPNFADSAIHMLGSCAIPIAIVMTGAVLADFATFPTLATEWKTTAAALILRLGVLPALILAAAWLLPIDQALRSVLVVQAAMPAAVFPIVTARLHHGDMPTALRVVLTTSVVSLFTIPIWLAFGLRLIEN